MRNRKKWIKRAVKGAVAAVLLALLPVVMPKAWDVVFARPNKLKPTTRPATNSLSPQAADSSYVKSIFDFEVKIENDGPKAALNALVSVEAPEGVWLTFKSIHTVPLGLEHVLNFRPSARNANVQIIRIDQLAPGQTVIVRYVGTSTAYSPKSEVTVRSIAQDFKDLAVNSFDTFSLCLCGADKCGVEEVPAHTSLVVSGLLSSGDLFCAKPK